jgi:RNA polymerase sigma factor FliA
VRDGRLSRGDHRRDRDHRQRKRKDRRAITRDTAEHVSLNFLRVLKHEDDLKNNDHLLAMIAEYQQLCANAQRIYFERFVSFVRDACRRAAFKHFCDPGDLVAPVSFALHKTLCEFSPERTPQKASSYLQQKMAYAVLDHLRLEGKLSRLTVKQRDAIHKTRARLESSFGRRATDEEIAEASGLPLSRVWELQQLSDGPSLDTNVADGREASLGSVLLVVDHAESEYNKKLSAVESLIAMAPANDRELLRLLYIKGLTMKKAGERLGLSESRISQMVDAARAEIRREGERRGYDHVWE